MKTFFFLLAAMVINCASLFGQAAFQSVIQGGTTIAFTWSSLSGMVYQVQYSTNLSSTVWSNLGSPILATNSTASATDAIGPDAARFYRVSSLVNSNTAPQPPTVVITGPLNNALFFASSTNITLAATATAAAGNPQVEFFQGTTSLGVLSNPPYNLVWSNATAGNYGLTAVATANGLSVTSATVNVTVTSLLTTNNLLIWLKADAITGLTNNAQVAFWPDSSGWGNNANSGPTNSQPLYITDALNGLPIVRLNGVNTFVYMPISTGGTVGLEALVVLKVATNRPYITQALWRIGQDTKTTVGYPNQNGQIVDDFGSLSGHNAGLPAQPLTQYHMYDVTGSNNGWTAWINEQLLLNSGGNAYDYGIYTTRYFLGFDSFAIYSQNFFAGDVAEVIIFNRTLTVAERDTLRTYIWSKYNLTEFATNAVPPTGPANLIATGQSPYDLHLEWVSTSDNATSFHIERKLGANGLYQDIGAVSSWVTSFDDLTLVPTNQYFYRVRAQNVFGDAYSSVISPPVASVSLVSADGYVITGATNLLVARASDASSTVNKIQIVNDVSINNLIDTGTYVPYTNIWVAGFSTIYSISALATDDLGNSRYSAPISITSYLDSNGDGIPDYFQVSQGEDPLNPWMLPVSDTNALNITLTIPTNAIIIP